MNITKREWALAMESEKNREMAMRILESEQKEGPVKPLGSNGEAIVKRSEPGDRKERRESDYVFWEETSNQSADGKVLNTELGTNIERNAEFGTQNAESRTENANAPIRRGGRVSRLHTTVPEEDSLAVTEVDGLKVFNVPQKESVKQLEPSALKVKREPDYAFWEETSENVPQVSPSFPGQQAESFCTLPSAFCIDPSPQADLRSTQHAARSTDSAPWPPLPGSLAPEEVPLTGLPSLGLAETITIADSLQVDHGMAAANVLGALSAAAVGSYGLRVKADYSEPLHLFIAIGANPSDRKSACMKMIFQGLYDYEKEEVARRAPAVKHYKESKELLEEGIARAKKNGDRLKMTDLIDELNSMQEVKDYELILTDATPEALSRAMSRNDGRMALVSSEGAFLNILAGGYSSNGAANVDVVLKGYSGEPVRVERIGRGSEKIDKASLSLCLAVQPDLLESFLKDPTLAGRGMASRFLCCLPQSRVGSRTLAGIPASPIVMERFDLRLKEIRSKKGYTEQTLSPEAYAAYDQWFQEIEKSLAPGGELAELGQGWGGKLGGNSLRIAGLLTLLTDDRSTVSEKTMRGAIELAKWFKAHELRLMGGDGELSAEANEALQYLIRRGESPVSAAKIRHALRKRKSFQKADSMELAFGELMNIGYIRMKALTQPEGAGRPAMPVIELHPGMLGSRQGGMEE